MSVVRRTDRFALRTTEAFPSAQLHFRTSLLMLRVNVGANLELPDADPDRRTTSFRRREYPRLIWGVGFEIIRQSVL